MLHIIKIYFFFFGLSAVMIIPCNFYNNSKAINNKRYYRDHDSN